MTVVAVLMSALALLLCTTPSTAVALTAVAASAAATTAAAPTCRCDCCISELLRDPDDAAPTSVGASRESRLQCAYDASEVQHFGGAVQKAECGSLCTRPGGDEVLAAAQDPEIDTQRFCYFECEPVPNLGVKTAKTSSEAGDACQPLSHNESLLVRDSSGNARSPMEVPQVMTHFLARRAKASVGGDLGAASADTSVVAAFSAVAPATRDWSSISWRAKKQSADITQWANDARWDAWRAKRALTEIEKSGWSATGALMTARVAAEKAKQESERASKAEARVHEIRLGLWKRALGAAHDAMPETMKMLQDTARAKAKVAAMNEAAKMQSDMDAQAPLAAEEAMKPYQASIAAIGETANQYLAAADKLSTDSATMQMGAQAQQNQGDQFMAVGSIPFAQKAMQKSRVMMNQATNMIKQADEYYDTAASIQQTLPAYGVEAEAAAQHASLLVNPDMLPASPMV